MLILQVFLVVLMAAVFGLMAWCMSDPTWPTGPTEDRP